MFEANAHPDVSTSLSVKFPMIQLCHSTVSPSEPTADSTSNLYQLELHKVFHLAIPEHPATHSKGFPFMSDHLTSSPVVRFSTGTPLMAQIT